MTMQVEQAQVRASSAEILALCEEFPAAPFIVVARHAIAHGASETRRLLREVRPKMNAPGVVDVPRAGKAQPISNNFIT